MSNTNLQRTENRLKALKLLWKSLSTDGKKAISLKSRVSYESVSGLINLRYDDVSVLDNKQDLIYDLLQDAQEQHIIEVTKIESDINELLSD